MQTPQGQEQVRRDVGAGTALWALAALTALAAALRFPTLGVQSFWFDESVTIVDVLQPGFGDTISALAEQDVNPPLYFALAWAWTQVLGDGEVAIRSLSALAGTATVPVAYLVGVELVSRRVGLVTAAFVAVSPLLAWYSQEARPYALLVLLGALSLLFFLRARRKPDARELALWSLFSCLALATHYFAAFLVVAEAALLLRDPARRRAVAVAAAPLVAVLAALAPLALEQRAQGGVAWVGSSPLGDRLGDVFEKFVSGYPSEVEREGGLGLSALLVAFGLVLLLRKGDVRERRGAALAAGLAGLAVLAPLVLAPDYFHYRYVVAGLLPLIVVGAAGFGARAAGGVGLAAAGLLFLVLLGTTVSVAVNPDLQREDWKGAAAVLGPVNAARVVVIPAGRSREPLELYGHPMTDLPPGGVRTREVVVLGIDGVERPWRGDDPPSPGPGFARAGARALDKVDMVRFRARDPVLVRPDELSARLGGRRGPILVETPVPGRAP